MEIIDDNLGQWRHPGKITRINSRDITMRDVPYPVIGIDATGMTRIMYPENDYRFNKGPVIEFPLNKYQVNGQVVNSPYTLDQLKAMAFKNNTEPNYEDNTKVVINRPIIADKEVRDRIVQQKLAEEYSKKAGSITQGRKDPIGHNENLDYSGPTPGSTEDMSQGIEAAMWGLFPTGMAYATATKAAENGIFQNHTNYTDWSDFINSNVDDNATKLALGFFDPAYVLAANKFKLPELKLNRLNGNPNRFNLLGDNSNVITATDSKGIQTVLTDKSNNKGLVQKIKDFIHRPSNESNTETSKRLDQRLKDVSIADLKRNDMFFENMYKEFNQRKNTANNNYEYIDAVPGTKTENQKVVNNIINILRNENPNASEKELSEIFNEIEGQSIDDVLDAEGLVYRDGINNEVVTATYNKNQPLAQRTLTKIHETNHTGFSFNKDFKKGENGLYIEDNPNANRNVYYLNEDAGYSKYNFDTNDTDDLINAQYLNADEISSFMSAIFSLFGKTKHNLTQNEVEYFINNIGRITNITGNESEYRFIARHITDKKKFAKWCNEHCTVLTGAGAVGASSSILLDNNETPEFKQGGDVYNYLYNHGVDYKPKYNKKEKMSYKDMILGIKL